MCPKCGHSLGVSAYTGSSEETYSSGGRGDTIQSAGTAICVILVILSLIGGIVLMTTNRYLAAAGLIVMAVGCLLAWLTTLLMRGFGQLISDTARIRHYLTHQDKSNNK